MSAAKTRSRSRASWEVDPDRAAALALPPDRHPGLQVAAEGFFQGSNGRIPASLRLRRGGGVRRSGGSGQGSDLFLRLPDGPGLRHGPARDLRRSDRVLDRQERASVAHGEGTVFQQPPHRRRQGQQAEHVGHRGPVLAHRLGNLLLRETEGIPKRFVALGFFQRAQLLPLQVLDQRQDEKRVVVHCPHRRRHLGPAELLDGPQPAFAGHEFVGSSAGRLPHDHGLEQAAALDRRRKLVQIARTELLSGLKGVGNDRPDRQGGMWPGRSLGRVGVLDGELPEQRSQASAQAVGPAHAPAPAIAPVSASAAPGPGASCAPASRQQLVSQRGVAASAYGRRLVPGQRDSEAGRLGDSDISRDDGREHPVAKVLRGLGRYLAREVEALVVHRQQDAFDGQSRVQVALDQPDGVQELGQPLQGVVLALDGDQHRVGGHKGVDREQSKRRRTIDQDVVVVGQDGRQRLGEDSLSVADAHKLDLRSGQVPVGRHDVQAAVPRDSSVNGAEDRKPADQDVVDRRPPVLRKPQPAGRVPLGVHVHDQNANVVGSQRRPQIDGRRRLPDAALLVRQGNDLGHVGSVSGQGLAGILGEPAMGSNGRGPTDNAGQERPVGGT